MSSHDHELDAFNSNAGCDDELWPPRKFAHAGHAGTEQMTALLNDKIQRRRRTSQSSGLHEACDEYHWWTQNFLSLKLRSG